MNSLKNMKELVERKALCGSNYKLFNKDSQGLKADTRGDSLEDDGSYFLSYNLKVAPEANLEKMFVRKKSINGLGTLWVNNKEPNPGTAGHTNFSQNNVSQVNQSPQPKKRPGTKVQMFSLLQKFEQRPEDKNPILNIRELKKYLSFLEDAKGSLPQIASAKPKGTLPSHGKYSCGPKIERKHNSNESSFEKKYNFKCAYIEPRDRRPSSLHQSNELIMVHRVGSTEKP
jgi:hypothetical protein